MKLTRTRTLLAISLAAALAIGTTQAVASVAPQSAVPASTPPTVNYVNDILDATGVAHLMMTDTQEEATSEEVLSGLQGLLSSATDLLGLNGTGIFPSGFAGAVTNPATGTLSLFWKGGVPEVLIDLLNTVVPDLNLTVHAADYTRSELAEIIEAHRLDMDNVELAFAKEDGSGIVVTHAPGTSIDAEGIAEITDVPVTVAELEPAEDAIGGRQADVSNSSGGHYGGAIMVRSGGVCSTGFPVLYGVYGYLLSAAHCDPTGNAAWNNGAGANLTPGGNQVSVEPSRDSMILNPVGGTTAFVYSGGVSSSTKRAVAGSGANSTGDSVTTSGANSGEHKNKIITNTAYPSNCNSYSCTLVLAGASTGIAVAQGDSGGPVYTIRTDGKVTAKGIIKGGTTQITQSSCTPLTRYDGTAQQPNRCYRYVTYVPIRTAVGAWQNTTLETR